MEKQQLAQRSLEFLKKLYPIVKSAGYDIKISDELRDAVAKTACADNDLLVDECKASAILFDNYSDDEIIKAIKKSIQQNVIFVNSKNSIEKYIELMKAELELRKSSVKWALRTNLEFGKERILYYHEYVIKYAPNTTMLVILLALNKMERECMF